jgi:hypothetical protein
MPAVSITGSQFTVTINSTARTDQVISGTITITPTVVRTKTLGSVAFEQTDLNGSAEIEFLYDEDTGMYNALEGAAAGGSSVALVVDGGAGTWTGSAVYVEELSMEVAADGVATCSCTFTGPISFA